MTDMVVLSEANRALAAGQRRGARGGWVRLLGSACALLATLCSVALLATLLPAVLREPLVILQLRAAGKSTRATVTQVRADRDDSFDSVSFWVVYRYSAPRPDGKPASYIGEEPITSEQYSRLKEGARVELRYVPGAPPIARMSSTVAGSFPWAPLAGGAALLIMGGLLGGGPLILAAQLWRQPRLARGGRLLDGQVVSFDAHQDRAGGWAIDLRYRFTTPAGQTVEGRQQGLYNDFRGQIPPPGAPLRIWYRDPQHHTVL